MSSWACNSSKLKSYLKIHFPVLLNSSTHCNVGLSEWTDRFPDVCQNLRRCETERPIWNRCCSTAPPFGETCRAEPMWPDGVRVIKTSSVSRWELHVCKHSRAIGVHWPQRGCLLIQSHPNCASWPDSDSTGVPRLKMNIFSTSCRLVSFFFFKVILTRKA